MAHDLTIVSGHLPPGHPESLVQWADLGGLRGTLVLMMAVENAPLIAEVLLRGGREAGHARWPSCATGTMPTERTVLTSLGELAGTTGARASPAGGHRDRRGGRGGVRDALPAATGE